MKEKIITFCKDYYIYIGIVFVTLVSLLVTLELPSEGNVNSVENRYIDIQSETYIYVDLQGSVLNPGVYKVESGTRLFELINRAGGLTFDANNLGINQSEVLTDEMYVYIPSIDELIENNSETHEENNGKININSATKTDLESLPGIGPATAQKIIDYRIEIGMFETIEDIMNVPGIGEITFQEIKDKIEI